MEGVCDGRADLNCSGQVQSDTFLKEFVSELEDGGINVHALDATQDARGVDAKKAFAVGLEFGQML